MSKLKIKSTFLCLLTLSLRIPPNIYKAPFLRINKIIKFTSTFFFKTKKKMEIGIKCPEVRCGEVKHFFIGSYIRALEIIPKTETYQ